MWPQSEVRSSWDCALAIILPGRATLTVQSLPFVGLKTAVGFVVSSSAGLFEDVPLETALASDWRFRFFALVSPLPIVLKFMCNVLSSP